MSRAYRSLRSRRICASACMGTARSAIGTSRQTRNAASVSAMDDVTSPAECGSKRARIVSVAGSTDSIVVTRRALGGGFLARTASTRPGGEVGLADLDDAVGVAVNGQLVGVAQRCGVQQELQGLVIGGREHDIAVHRGAAGKS